MIRVILPYHLRTLARIVEAEVQLDVPAPVTLAKALDAIEAHYPVLRGAIRDHDTLRRRPFIRFFVCREDWSHEPTEKELPEAIVNGAEPLMVIGAIAGG
jgi:molybdopterin synthase sulfur carrier subunit